MTEGALQYVGLMAHDGKEVSYPGYERQLVDWEVVEISDGNSNEAGILALLTGIRVPDRAPARRRAQNRNLISFAVPPEKAEIRVMSMGLFVDRAHISPVIVVDTWPPKSLWWDQDHPITEVVIYAGQLRYEIS